MKNSDVDLAVTAKPGTGLFALSDVHLYAKEQLGAEVDLTFLASLDPVRFESSNEGLFLIF